jgi:hypothetical protein
MGWLPQATKRDVGAPAKYSNGLMHSHLGIVLHVNDSQGNQVTSTNGDSLYNWITGGHGMSCHFQVSQMGVIEQYIDTRYSSWCQAGGNDDYLSIETEGHPDTALTDLQVQACAAILAFCHAEHGIPLQLADRPGDRGFGWHGMGAPGWGHASCPGELRKAQRTQILQLAAQGGLIGDGMSAAEVQQIQTYIAAQSAADRKWLQNYVDAKLGGTIIREVADASASAAALKLLSDPAGVLARVVDLQKTLAAAGGIPGGVDLAAIAEAARAGAAAGLNGATLTTHDGGTQ